MNFRLRALLGAWSRKRDWISTEWIARGTLHHLGPNWMKVNLCRGWADVVSLILSFHYCKPSLVQKGPELSHFYFQRQRRDWRPSVRAGPASGCRREPGSLYLMSTTYHESRGASHGCPPFRDFRYCRCRSGSSVILHGRYLTRFEISAKSRSG